MSKIETTLHYAEQNDTNSDVVATALDINQSHRLISKLENDERVRVRLSAEQFAKLCVGRRNDQVEDSLKWSKAVIIASDDDGSIMDLS